ncbi:hypothetical protein JTE90_002983 [Oedothorax gibbosus]|uniref:Uncharacterized protein n=1 Tax=Oedothorax gibbosus TaxID=931172 RepID=A0AAV6VFZ9_9ARAC|nr:hypothetical protein JTE90_002983 [Oedothorax gibbosus]
MSDKHKNYSMSWSRVTVRGPRQDTDHTSTHIDISANKDPEIKNTPTFGGSFFRYSREGTLQVRHSIPLVELNCLATADLYSSYPRSSVFVCGVFNQLGVRANGA